ncbi:MAG: diacylglycerol kinase family protein [Candidatus Microsaccharimonas sp.]
MRVVIIYNPNSTGNGKANAQELAKELRKYDVSVLIRKTTHPGHGAEIAESYARRNEEIVLISSSGDGGYHEVINGALLHKTSKLVVGVLPSGNANDHYTAIGTGSLVDSIRLKKFRSIDTIRITSTIKGKPWVRYAHSYAGIGITARAAKDLIEERPNVFTEKWIIVRSLFSIHYAKIKEKNDTNRYSSLVFSNIYKMSKVMKLSEVASVTDGKFEVAGIRFRSKLRLILHLLTAATVGLKNSPSVKRYEFKTIPALPIQLDGEVYTLDKNSAVKVEAMRRNLRCVL